MFYLKSEIEFDTAHFLSNHYGKCANIHGHRYRLIVKIKAQGLKSEGFERGMVADFSKVKDTLKVVGELFDHKLLLEDDDNGRDLLKRLEGASGNFETVVVPYRPTVEEMSRHIFNIIKEQKIDIYEVELFETPTNSCVYREEY